MNLLERFIKINGLDEIIVMDLLQDKGVVSDNAVHAKDVAQDDSKAVDWLIDRWPQSRRQ